MWTMRTPSTGAARAVALVVAAAALGACHHEPLPPKPKCAVVRDAEVASGLHPFGVVCFTGAALTGGFGVSTFQTRGENLYLQGSMTGGEDGLWISDGTAANVRMLASRAVYGVGSDGSYLRKILPVDGGAFFAVYAPRCTVGASSAVPREPLWWTDDQGNSQMLLGKRQVYDVVSTGDRLFFATTDPDDTAGLWTADVRTRQLQEVAHFASIRTVEASSTQGVFLGADRAGESSTIWYSDGTATGTRGLSGACSATDAYSITAVGCRAFFVCGRELWVSDGTPAGTGPVPGAPTERPANWNYPPDPGSMFGTMADAGGRLAFFFIPNIREPKGELWVADGTAAGTQRLATFSPADSYSWQNVPYVLLGNTLYLGIEDVLWKTDGTLAGTGPVVALGPLGGGDIREFASLSGVLFVQTDSRLWRVDGDSAQQVPIDPSVVAVRALVATPSRIYYGAVQNRDYFRFSATVRSLTCEDQ
jgi:ELWxxDGT repeat protein